VSPRHAKARPPKVTGVTGSPGGSGEAVVDWDPSTATDVGCYRVYRALAKAGPLDLRVAVPVQGTTILTPPGSKGDSSSLVDSHSFVRFDGSRFDYSDLTYEPHVAGNPCCFFYRVAAVDDAGDEGPQSDVVCVEPLPKPANENGCAN
jgi:hypothetical protein